MANKIQIKRGTNLSNAGTPAVGELIYKTDTKKLYIGDGSTAASSLTPVGGASTSGSNNQLLTDDGSGGINSEGSLLFSGSTLEINNSGDWSYIKNNTNSGGLRLGTKDSGGTFANQIEISNTGNYVKLNENTTITGSLTTSSTFNSNSNIYLADNMTLYVGTDTTNGMRMFHLSSNNNNYIRSNGGTLSIETMAAQPMYFNTENTNSMMIDANHQVGIGTVSPQDLFHVQLGASGASSWNYRNVAIFEGSNSGGATIAITGKNTGYSGIFFGDQDSTTQGQIQFDHTTNKFKFLDGGVLHAVIDTSGKLGIGVESPAYKLHVEQAGGVMQQLKATDSNQAYMKFVNSTTGDGQFSDGFLLGLDSDESVAIWNYESTTMRFATAGTERMRIDASGNVGIGVTPSGGKLHVNGDLRVIGKVLGVFNTGFVSTDSVGNQATLMRQTSGDIMLIGDTNHTEQIKIQSANSTGNGYIHGKNDGGIGFSGNTEFSSPMTVYYGAVFNEGGHNSDFRVESDNKTHCLFVDANEDIVKTEALRDEATNIGYTGGHGVEGNQLSEANWSSLPTGFGGMMRSQNQNYGNPGSTYFYFHKISQRDTAGGWGGIALAYANNAEFYVGHTTTSSNYATWSKVWNEANDGAGSGLDADTLDGQHASAFLTAGSVDAATLDGYDSTRFFRRQGSASATVGPGWMTVATNTSGRKAGEILVTDGDSGDHGFIRIHWLRSFADSNFTVINCGGHANRITGVRVLSQDSDNTYGEKILQVYVTASSAYEAKIFRMGDNNHYSDHTIHTPTIENSISGYSVHGNALETLNTFGFAHEEGIRAGGEIRSDHKIYAARGDTGLAAYFENTSSNGTVMQLKTTGDNKSLYFQTDHIYGSGEIYLGTGGQYTRYRGASHTWQLTGSNTTNMTLNSNQLLFAQPVRLQFANDQRIFDNGSGGLSVGAESHELRLYSGGTDPIEFRMGGRNGTTRCMITYDGQYHWGSGAGHGTLTWDTGKAILTSQSGNTLELRSQNATDMIAIETNQTRFIADGTERMRVNGNGLDLSYTSVNKIVMPAASTRDKYRVWTASNYAIGMQNSFTFGALNSYAMTFQMNNQDNRGFWWGDDGHGQGNGAMALTTDGKLTVAHAMRIGYGTSDTTAPGSYGIDISASNNLRLSSASDQMIRFERNGGNTISIEHDSSQMYFYNRATSKVMLLMSNSGSAIMGYNSNPTLEIRNTGTSSGNGGSLSFGHSQDSSNTAMARISGYLADGSAAGRAGYLRFWTSRAGSDELAMQLQNDNKLRLYQPGDVSDYGEWYVDDTRVHFHAASGNYHRFTTDHGYIELGPANSGWGHINTDRSKFYFNVPITVDGGNIDSYDEDLHLRRAGSNDNKLVIETAQHRHYVQGNEEFKIDASGSRTLGISRADDYFQKNASGATGCLLKLVNSGWSNATTHDILYNHYQSTLGDYTYLKSAGNGTNDHGIVVVADNYIFMGKDNLTTGNVDNSATAPITDACFRLDMNGNGLFDGDVVAFSTTIASDARLKENVKDLNYGLKDVLDIRPVSFDWKEKRDGQHDIGVIAQEIEKIIPEVVVEVDTLNSEDTHKTVDYAKLTSVLIKAVQEQQEQINELKEKLNG